MARNKTRATPPDCLPMNPSTDDQAVYNTISPAMLLDIFDEPIVFQRAYVGLTGSAVAALFLSYAIYTTERLPKDAEGWFRKTGDQWKAETGLTRFEQQTARRILRELDVLIERRAGLPAELWFKIRVDRILELLSDQAEAKWGQVI
ncbi:MAG: hypothetical protein U0932_00985 [Thiobacillus sp.]|nr:hypothetical protein [Thiobacillus sp.]MBU1223704.1 hypothetical protein [Gammaproteobacteria bacterium]MBN8773116.1 hypothetical protein [Thiobacillus sp.]MBU1409809.1 hypothetical protein [Gammaproteobacteria bacterium]MDZ7593200.1 hypothetical protein [Thiobacillus sp.]